MKTWMEFLSVRSGIPVTVITNDPNDSGVFQLARIFSGKSVMDTGIGGQQAHVFTFPSQPHVDEFSRRFKEEFPEGELRPGLPA